MDASAAPTAHEDIAIAADPPHVAAASPLVDVEPPGPSSHGDSLSNRAWESDCEESSSLASSSPSAITSSSSSSDTEDNRIASTSTMPGQSAGSGSAKTIALHAMDGDAGGSPTAAPPVADPDFVLQGKAASKLNKAQAIAAMERAGLPVPQGKEATVPHLRKALQEWHSAWKVKEKAGGAKEATGSSKVRPALCALSAVVRAPLACLYTVVAKTEGLRGG